MFNNDAIKRTFVEQLRITRDRLRFRLLAWVIMPEHVHLVLIPLDGMTVSRLLSAIKRPFAARVLDRWRELNAPVIARLRDSSDSLHFWQAGGGYDRSLCTSDELFEKINYCHLNPQTRGLVAHPTDWVWSSARWYAGERDDALLGIDEYSA